MSIAEIPDTIDHGPAPEGDKTAREWIAKQVVGILT